MMLAPQNQTKIGRFGWIGSLEQGTCSDRATSHLIGVHGAGWQRSYYASFPELITATAMHTDRLFLLPHIHPLLPMIATDTTWQFCPEFSFPYQNPPLHVGARGTKVAGSPRCAALPVLMPYAAHALGKVAAPAPQFVEATNTQDAARQCAHGAVELCVTNQAGMDQHGLNSIARLEQLEVWWCAFSQVPKEYDHD